MKTRKLVPQENERNQNQLNAPQNLAYKESKQGYCNGRKGITEQLKYISGLLRVLKMSYFLRPTPINPGVKVFIVQLYFVDYK